MNVYNFCYWNKLQWGWFDPFCVWMWEHENYEERPLPLAFTAERSFWWKDNTATISQLTQRVVNFHDTAEQSRWFFENAASLRLRPFVGLVCTLKQSCFIAWGVVKLLGMKFPVKFFPSRCLTGGNTMATKPPRPRRFRTFHNVLFFVCPRWRKYCW